MNPSTKESPIAQNTIHWLKKDDKTKQNIDAGLTAFLALQDPFMSMATRVHLIHNAQHHLDLQYYIWKDDLIGHHLLSELLQAADRGVKVRLLIDDQNGTDLDETLYQLSQHENINIKLFNPYKYRNFRVIDYVFRFNNINHRMHNKLIIADGAVAVTGGRNISSEYFDASQEFQFADMDIFFGGKSVIDANKTFLNFWNDELSYPIETLYQSKTKNPLNEIRKTYSESSNFKEHQTEQRIKQAEKLIQERLTQHPVRWAKAHFLADTPNKIRRNELEENLLFNQIMNVMGQPKNHMELVSAYFVPTQDGTDYLNGLVQNNIKVRVVTNSLVANDVALVHAFYQKYRKSLLKNGVKLYEYKPFIEREDRTWYEIMTGNVIPAKGKNSSSLHAKFFDIDGMVFIGSFNFDPRSVRLNSEVGLVVESDELQNEISTLLNTHLKETAYELSLNDKGEILWTDYKRDGSSQTHQHDPESTAFQRTILKLISYLPIEWMM